MKKRILPFLAVALILSACEVEPVDSVESLSATEAKAKLTGKKDNAITFDTSCAPTQETDLIAGQNQYAGTVRVTKVDAETLEVVFQAAPGFCITETHLDVAADPSEFPVNGGGNPKIGNFEYQGSHYCEGQVVYTVPATGTYIAAHAVVKCIEEDPQSILSKLPETVSFCPSRDSRTWEDPAYWAFAFQTGLTGTYGGWCVDADSPLENGVCLEDVPLFPADENLPEGILEKPENLDALNWLLNQELIGTASSAGGLFTYGDFQVAVWNLVDNGICCLPSLGDYSEDRALELVNLALANGEGYTPGCGEYMGLILVPVDRQPVIFGYKLDCEAGECEETAWAEGCPFPGNSWATFFKYE